MDTIAFLPVIDLPLTGLLLAGFLLNSWHWAKTGSTESNVDLEARLPRALIKISLFFAVTLVVCWLINLGAWTLFLVLLVVGLLVTIFAGRHAFAPELMFVFTAGMLREWAFGFPNLILAPPTNNRPTEEEAGQEFLGKLAVATSPLRPTGKIRINTDELSAVSDSGTLIETGTEVVVVGIQNGQVRVEVAE